MTDQNTSKAEFYAGDFLLRCSTVKQTVEADSNQIKTLTENN